MGNIWHDISPARITAEDFIAYIEIEKGSKNKYELDKQTGMLILDRILYTSRPTTASSRAPTATTATRWTCWCCAARTYCPRRWCAAAPSA